MRSVPFQGEGCMRQDLRSIGIVAGGLVSLAALSMPGCERTSASATARDSATQTDSWVMSNSDRAESKAARLAAVMDVGNGVYVFPKTYFPQTLSDFRETHPEREIISISQGSDLLGGSYGSKSGAAENFIVVTSVPGTD